MDPSEGNAVCRWVRLCTTEKAEMIESDDVMSALSVNQCLKTQGQGTSLMTEII